jgi:NAD-dependent SIR2 family protein deacetylase
MVSSIDDLVELIESSNRIVVLTGAGISVAAGIPDFRSERGLYQMFVKYIVDFY